MDFRIKCRDGWRARIAWVIESVASSRETDAVCFGFLGSNTADEVGVGHFSIFRDVGFGDREHGTSADDELIDGAR